MRCEKPHASDCTAAGGFIVSASSKRCPRSLADLPELVIDRGHSTREPPARSRQTWRDNNGRLVATGGHEGQSWWMDWPGLATFRFGEQGPVVAAPVTHNRDVEIRDVFVRGVLPVVLLARGCEALHASAVAIGDGEGRRFVREFWDRQVLACASHDGQRRPPLRRRHGGLPGREPTCPGAQVAVPGSRGRRGARGCRRRPAARAAHGCGEACRR